MKPDNCFYHFTTLTLFSAAFIALHPTAFCSNIEYNKVERGQDHTAWQRVDYETNIFGNVTAHTNRYVEMETGKWYQTKDGTWLETSEEIELTKTGAEAAHGPHKVTFASNLNSPVGVEVLTPDSKRLKFRVLGLAYYDYKAGKTGKNVVIAEAKDSWGVLMGTNQVLYEDVFTDVRCDVRYTYRKDGLEQDLILRQRPPLPEEFGLNPSSTRLLLYTEFINAPHDVKTTDRVRRGWKKATVAKIVDFGAMQIGQGTAFSLGQDSDRRRGVPVEKNWVVSQGRTFLVEEVSFPRIRSQLRNLQAMNSGNHSSGDGKRKLLAINRVSADLKIPAARPHSASSRREMQVASIAGRGEGLVLDFDLQSAANVVLQGDTTYLVSGQVNLSGTTVIEGGTVIKYAPGARINFAGPVKCLTGPYKPAVFTARDDDTAGAIVSGSTGNPLGTYADCALSLGMGGDLQYIFVRYANEAVYCGSSYYSVSHSQFAFCHRGLHSETADFNDHNILMFKVDLPFYGSFFNGRVEHLTCDQADTLVTDLDFQYMDWCGGGPSSSLTLVNSLTTSVTNGYGNIWPAQDHVENYGSGQNVFQTAGAGAHYIALSARMAGTTAIDPTLSAALKALTVAPPIVYTDNTISSDTTFRPQAPRDTGVPTIGYHYPPLDYLFGGVQGNANIAFEAGTAVGWYRTSEGWYHAGHGIHMANGKIIRFNGTADQPTFWVRGNTVQEGIPGRWEGHYGPGGITGWAPSIVTAPQIRARFLHASELANDMMHFRDDWGWLSLQAAHCEFYNGGLGGYASSLYVTNCLVDRCSVWLEGGQVDIIWNWRNCTFHGGGFSINRWSSPTPVSVYDSAFDSTTISTSDSYANNAGLSRYDYNAFLQGSTRFTPTGANDLLLNNFNWQSNRFGQFYLPASSPLTNRGSVSAPLVGLFHFTTQTNQQKELNSQVDRGYHYVAVDGNGKPFDGDGDGLADYLEDSNGDGVYNAGDLSSLTNPSTDGSGMSDGWELKYFGHIGVDPNADYDGDGISNLTEYQNHGDPNTIAFTASITNAYVRTSSFPVHLNVTGGVPASVAVLVDSTNAAFASWLNYTSPDITVASGTSAGWHNVWIGLRGLPADAQQTWVWKRVKLDTTPPLLILTNPVGSTVTQQLVQLRGYCPEPLANISYDISNAIGVRTNQPVWVRSQVYNTNSWEYSTNTFQAIDVALAVGLNTITLHATDLAGNTTNKSLSLMLDYSGKTHPPVFQLYWPQNGNRASGTSFTVRGRLDDCSVALTASLTDQGGSTYFAKGLIERDGNFWLKDLPLHDGTSQLTLTATDVVGHTATTNITIARSTGNLAFTPPTGSDLNRRTVDLVGTLDVGGYAVWVNGVRATDSGGGSWQALNVPMTAGGCAVIQARAIPLTDHGGAGTGGGGAVSYSNSGNPTSAQAFDVESDNDKPVRVYVSRDTASYSYYDHDHWASFTSGHWTDWQWWHNNAHDWQDGQESHGSDYYRSVVVDSRDGSSDRDCSDSITWPASDWPDRPIGWGTAVGEICRGTTPNSYRAPVTVAMEHCEVSVSAHYEGGYGDNGDAGLKTFDPVQSRSAQTTVNLFTGTKGVPAQRLFMVSGWAYEILNKWAIPDQAYAPPTPWWPDTPMRSIDPTQIRINGKYLNSDGIAYFSLADNVTIDLTPRVDGLDFYWFGVDAIRLPQIDLDVDSNNDGTIGDDDDPIEEQPPGKYVPVNDGDRDGDGIVDFADGYNKFGTPDVSGQSAPFTPMTLTIPVDPTKAKVKFSYSESDPNGVQQHTGTNGTYYTPADGGLRIWTKDGGEYRKKEEVDHYIIVGGNAVQDGNFIANEKEYWATNIPSNLYLEGIHPGTYSITVQLDPDGHSGYISSDKVTVTVVSLDLDVDSDNNNGLNPPDRSPIEDLIEDDSQKPGKIIWVHKNDADTDGLPDYVDGFNWSQDDPADDIISADDHFVPLIFELKPYIDRPDARIRITYNGSDPAAVTYDDQADPPVWQLAPGNLRIWLKDANQARNKNSANGLDSNGDTVTPGDYIAPGSYKLSDLGLSAAQQTVTLYIEGIAPSAGEEIQTEIDLDGDGPLPALKTDAVRVTIADATLHWVKQDRETQAVVPVDTHGTSDARPQVSLAIQGSPQLDANGTLHVSLTCEVADRLSELVSASGQQVQRVDFYVNGQMYDSVPGLPLMATGASPSWPWQPSPFDVSFTHDISIPNTAGGNYRIGAMTSPNAAGKVGWADVGVDLKWDILSPIPTGTLGPTNSSGGFDTVSGHVLDIAYFTNGTAKVYFGDRDPLGDDLTVSGTGSVPFGFTGQVRMPTDSGLQTVPISLTIEEQNVMPVGSPASFVAHVVYGPANKTIEYSAAFLESSAGSQRYVQQFYTGLAVGSSYLLLPDESGDLSAPITSMLYAPLIEVEPQLTQSLIPRIEPSIIYVTVNPDSIPGIPEQLSVKVNGQEFNVTALPNGDLKEYYIEDPLRPGWPRFFVNSPSVQTVTPSIATPNLVLVDGGNADAANTLEISHKPPSAPVCTAMKDDQQFWYSEWYQFPSGGSGPPPAVATPSSPCWSSNDLVTAYFLMYGNVGMVLLQAFTWQGDPLTRDNVINLDSLWFGRHMKKSGVWGLIGGKRYITIDNCHQDVFQGAECLWKGLHSQMGCTYRFWQSNYDNDDYDQSLDWVALAHQSGVAISQDAKELGILAVDVYEQAIVTIVPGARLVVDIKDISEGDLLPVLGYLDKIPFRYFKNVTVKIGGKVWCTIYSTGCFAEGTPVQTPEGPVPIEQLQTGSRVFTYDLKNGTVRTQQVRMLIASHASLLQGVGFGSDTVWLTPNHPLWSLQRGWIPAGSLEPTDELLDLNGQVRHGLAAGEKKGDFKVYTLEVEGDHDFFVGESGILVHNRCGLFGGVFGSSKKLTIEMINNIGIALSKGCHGFPSVKPAGSRAHHIVAHGHQNIDNVKSVQLLMDAGLTNPDGWWNGVFLPQGKATSTSKSAIKSFKDWLKDPFGKKFRQAVAHESLHTDEYFLKVNDRLRQALVQYQDASGAINLRNLSTAQLQQAQDTIIQELDRIRMDLLNGVF